MCPQEMGKLRLGAHGFRETFERSLSSSCNAKDIPAIFGHLLERFSYGAIALTNLLASKRAWQVYEGLLVKGNQHKCSDFFTRATGATM